MHGSLGGGLYSSLNDVSKFPSAILNDGTSLQSQAQILKPEPMRQHQFTDSLPGDVDRSLLGGISRSIPAATHAVHLTVSIPADTSGWSSGGAVAELAGFVQWKEERQRFLVGLDESILLD